MPSLTSPFRRVGRLVADQVGRLHAALERLAGEVRAAIARAVGQATGEAAREALRVILDGPPDRPGYERPEDRDGGWGQPRRPTWPAPRAYDPYARDPYERDPDDDPDEDRRHRLRQDEDEDPPAEEPVAAQRPGSWSRAVAVGCQAASWWLRRHPGRFSLIAAAGDRHRRRRGDAGQQPAGRRRVGRGRLGAGPAGPRRRRLFGHRPGRPGPEVTAVA